MEVSALDTAVDAFLGRETNFDFYVKKFYFTNACTPKFFSQADVVFERRGIENCFLARNLVRPGIDYLKRYKSKTELPDDQDVERRKCLDCLRTFFQNKEHHLECLRPFMDWSEYDNDLMPDEKKEKRNKYSNKDMESVYQFLLAEHVFSPLIPGNKYDLDMDHFRKTVVAMCPGKCNKPTRNHTKTHTGIGHEEVWHGYIDIYLNKQVPVKIYEGTEAEAIVATTEDDERENEEGDVEVNEDSSMETETEQEDPYESSMVIEVKVDNVLEQKNVVAQTASQAVVNSFIQAKDTSGFIPTICTTLGVLRIYLYDSLNDIFLLSDQVSYKINEDFVDDVIIILWMVLNYEYFLVKPPRLEEMGDVKANFEKQAQDKLSIYKNQLKKMVHFPQNKSKTMVPVVKQYLQMKLKSR